MLWLLFLDESLYIAGQAYDLSGTDGDFCQSESQELVPARGLTSTGPTTSLQK